MQIINSSLHLPSHPSIWFDDLFNIVFHGEVQVITIFHFWFIDIKHDIWTADGNAFLFLDFHEEIVERADVKTGIGDNEERVSVSL